MSSIEVSTALDAAGLWVHCPLFKFVSACTVCGCPSRLWQIFVCNEIVRKSKAKVSSLPPSRRHPPSVPPPIPCSPRRARRRSPAAIPVQSVCSAAFMTVWCMRRGARARLLRLQTLPKNRFRGSFPSLLGKGKAWEWGFGNVCYLPG